MNDRSIGPTETHHPTSESCRLHTYSKLVVVGGVVVVVIDSMASARADGLASAASLFPQPATKSAAHASATHSPPNEANVDFTTR